MTSHPPHDPTPTHASAATQDKLDALLTNHLTVSLEPQRGRAVAAFRAKLAEKDTPAPIPLSRGHENLVSKRALWYWAGVPSLVAAGLAVVVTLQVAKQSVTAPITPQDPGAVKIADIGGAGGTTISNVPVTPPAKKGTLVFDQYVTSQDLNGGIAVLDGNTPVRVIRHLQTRQTQLVDPNDHAVYTITEEPVEKVGYVQIHPN